MRIIIRLISILPFFAGPMIIRPPANANPDALNGYIRLYLAFLSTFAFFGMAKYFIERYSRLNSSKEPKRTGQLWLMFLASITTSILTLLSLAMFRDKFDQAGFLLLMAAISSTTFGQMFYYRRLIFAALISWFIYTLSVCQLSFYIESSTIHWQSIFFSLSLSSMVCAVWVAMELSGKPLLNLPESAKKRYKTSDKPMNVPRLRLLHALLLISAPLYIGFLFYAGQLSKQFLSVFILIPLSGRLLPSKGFTNDASELPRYFLAQTTGTCVIFVGIIAVLRFLSPS